MQTIPGFRDAFIQAAQGLGSFNPGVPTSADDILQQTVGEWRAQVQTAINLLGNIPPAAGDFTDVIAELNNALDVMAPFAASDTIEFALNTIDPSGGSVDQVQQSFDEAVADLAAALWDTQNGVFTSPNFAVNLATGAWSTQGTSAPGYSGTGLDEFWNTLGQAAGNAIMSFIGSEDSLLGALLLEGADSAAFAQAKTVAAEKAADAFEEIQAIGTQFAADREGVDPADISQRAKDGIQDLVDGLANVLPGFGGALDGLIFGSRNSDPTFVLALQENIQGSEHGDWFVLTKGNDTFDGGLGMDVLFGLEGNDTLMGGADNDVLDGGDDDDVLSGGDDNDLILGGNGNDMLDGDAGDDEMLGGDGDDTLTGGVGDDTVTGGTGADVFIVGQGDGTLKITDFEQGSDTIDLSSFARADALAALAAATDGAEGTTLTLGDGTAVTLVGAGVTAASLSTDDLVLADAAPNSPPAGTAVIAGTLEVGQTLSVDASNLSDADGITAGTETYQWQRDGVDIAGATNATYLLSADDIGAAITVVYGFTDDLGTDESVTSAETAPIAGPPANTAPTGGVSLQGDILEGSTLTADTSAVVDADGIVAGTETYQWRRDGVDIPGATDSTYVTTADDIDQSLRVLYGYTDGNGTVESILSEGTAGIINVNDEPTGAVIITGTLEVGETLTADISTVVDADGPGRQEEGFAWQRNGVFIDGANAATYQLVAADAGAEISVLYGYRDDAGFSELLTSAESTIPAASNSAPTGTVVISGTTANEGSTLIADISGVVDADGIDTNTITFQWQRRGIDIDGETGASYDVTAADVGQDLTVILRYTDNQANDETLTSAPVTATALGQLVDGDGTGEDLAGGAGDDTINGGGGEDTLDGGAGNDTLDGGDDIDRAVFDGPQESYTLKLSAAGTTLTDRRDDGTGTDTLTALEFLDFGGTVGSGDAGFKLFQQTGIATLEAAPLESFIELYIAYFNRAPDAEGLGFWGTAFANGFSLSQIANFFIDQDETRATYPEGQSNADFATAVYNNVLGRVPDQDGFNFWVGALDSGGVSRDQFILSVLGGAKIIPDDATPEFLAQQALDRQYLADKTDIGAYFSVLKGMSDVDDASAAMALFDGSAASITAAVNAIDGFYADALDTDTGAFLIQVVGVLDDPFGVA